MIAVATFFLHCLTAWRYGYFRDELYFIACGRHLAWGYVDQPPLVAFVAWLAQPAHDAQLALRILPALAAALAVAVTVELARDLGGGRFARTLAGTAVALLPAYLLLGNLLTTTSFEALSWSLVTWLTIRIVRARDDGDTGAAARLYLYAACAIAFGLYGKYSMGLLFAALLVGLLLTRERRALATPWVAACAALTTLLVLPNFLWQATHGWAFLAVIAGDAAHRHAFNNGLSLETHELLSNALAFAAEQFVYTNPLSAPVWICGIIAPFTWPKLRALRFVSLAFGVLMCVAIVLEAKGYYVIGIYAPLLAIGAVVVERAATWMRTTAFAALAVVGILTLPLSIPVLPLDGFIAYTKLIGMTGQNGTPARLMQPVYAEEFGWDRLARDVARYYDALPPETRNATAIYADTYADAGAIDLFGPAYGLPQAIGSQNTYWLWGTRDYDGSSLLAIGASRFELLQASYASCKLLGTSDEPLKWVVEGPAPIYLCTHPNAPFAQIWDRLRWYGA